MQADPNHACLNTCMNIPKEIEDRIVYKKNNTGEIRADMEFYKLLPLLDTCELCDRKCERARVEMHVWLEDAQAWAHKCLECNKYKDPVTHKFTTTKTVCYSAIAKQMDKKDK